MLVYDAGIAVLAATAAGSFLLRRPDSTRTDGSCG
jgi:hypothetical protein